MRHIFFLILFLLPAAAISAPLTDVTLTDGRTYKIAVPAGVKRPPLILALHGGGGNPGQFERQAGLTDKALKRGFAIAYPSGSGRGPLLTWNAIYCCAYASEKGIDDVDFLDRVVRDAAVKFGIDDRRIFVTGMSNGSMMAETYAAQRAWFVRAVAGVAGTMDVRSVKLIGRVPLLHIHGTNDQHVLYEGGYGPDAKVKVDFVAVKDLLAAFLKSAPRDLAYTEMTIDTVDDGMSTDVLTWSKDDRAWVVHYRVNGGGHAWPGSRRGTGGTLDFAAADAVLSFFSVELSALQ